ncbi:hypothetical protein FQB35_15595 (plasmid) [Crassaminicella thermophila]|uniref:ORF6C domain-containing protein n=1 Tax=Crassaminicella thermophila TaxID=2599308 RepID=A0A5C0SKT2_CRATE|nr:Rha family transcriptional regulator [Crassaminicella thermophila]QEK13748.1 hypothetical protein FQB35_15595 [Crassaminicella thermophila]
MNELITKPATLDSREVAEMIGKRHSDLLRDIETYIQYLENAKLRSQDFFLESTYKAEGNNKTYKRYDVTKKGCEFIAHKLTGQKGAIFTARYINKFHEMENQIRTPKCIEDVIILQLEEQKKIKKRIEKLENNMTIDYAQQNNIREKANAKIVSVLGGKDAPAYQKLNKKAFSQFWKDYRRYMQVGSYKDTAVAELEKAKDFIKRWTPNEDLRFMILGANSQMRIESENIKSI